MSASKQAQARELKHRVLRCLHKLSDRDTHAAAASELESIARTLSSDALPPFISSISATDSSDKSPVRRQCIRLISVLSEHHGNSLSPHLSKLLSAIVRRLRDPDSSVRSACVAASLSLASQLDSPTFSSITRPFLECLFIEQHPNNQTGAALCLAAIIEGSNNPDAGTLKKLLPRLEKLAKCESFKAKPALLALIGSLLGVKGVISENEIKNLLMCVMEFLSSEDWSARKAAAEAITKMAYAEKALLSEYKASCLKTFEAKRFDKVKAARETMNQMIEAWKEIPDSPDEVPHLLESQASSKIAENARDGEQSPFRFRTPQISKNSRFDRRASLAPSPASSSAGRRLSLDSRKVNIKDRALFRKLYFKKPIHSNLGKVVPEEIVSAEHEMESIDKPMFNISNEKQSIDDEFKQSGSETPDIHRNLKDLEDLSPDIHRNQKDLEDLSLIRNQLLQIENQQTQLLDLFQRFMGSSQTGIQSLEARVHGLELAIDEISFDFTVSSGRVSQNSNICCKIPTDFLSTKLWKKSSQTVHGIPSACRNDATAGEFSSQKRKFRSHVVPGLATNPLAEIPETSSGRI